jgi:hypothetical protein
MADVALDDRPDFAFTTLSSGIAGGATSVPLTDAADFDTPSAGYYCVIWGDAFDDPSQDSTREWIRATGKSGSNLTPVTRGQLSTSAKAWDAGAKIMAAIPPSMIDDIETAINNASKLAIAIQYWYADVAADLSAVTMWKGNAAGSIAQHVALRAGSVIGVSASHNGTITGGSITVEPRIEGAVTGLTVTLNSGTSEAVAEQAGGLDTFVAADKIQPYISSSGLSPTTIDVCATMFLLLDN